MSRGDLIFLSSVFTDVTSVAVLTGMPAHSLITKTPTLLASTIALCASRPIPTCSHSRTIVASILKLDGTAVQNAERLSASPPNYKTTAVCTKKSGSLPALCASGASLPRLASGSTWKCNMAVPKKHRNSLGFRPVAQMWVGALGLTLRWCRPRDWILMGSQSLTHHTMAPVAAAHLGINNSRNSRVAVRRGVSRMSVISAAVVTVTPARFWITRTVTRWAPISATPVRRSSPTWWHSKTTDASTLNPSVTSARTAVRLSGSPPSSSATVASTPRRSLSHVSSVINASPANPT